MLYVNETADAALNQSNLHIILVSGLKGTLKHDRREKNAQAVNAAHAFLDQIEAGKLDLMFSTFIPGPPPRSGCLPMLKLSFGSHGDAFHVKRKFGVFRKINSALCSDIYLTPEQTRATRVRAAIMTAMCRKSRVQELVKGAKPQVTKFEIKPDICYRNEKTGKIERRIGFKEACDRFLQLLSTEDLQIARKIAGKAFEKRLTTLFRISE